MTDDRQEQLSERSEEPTVAPPPEPTWATPEAATETARTQPVDPAAPIPGPAFGGPVPAGPEAVTIPALPRSSSGSGLRWGVALVVTALIVAVAGAAFYVVTGSSTASTASRWAPRTSIFYSEARFDLPGDQQQKLGQFLSNFPGFADQSSLGAKLDEAFDRIVRGSTHDQRDYTTEIKPWFGGQVGVALTAPALGEVSPGGVFLVTITDATKAAAWIAKLPAQTGSTSETYKGTQLTLFDNSSHKEAYGIVDGRLLVAGTVAAVHATIDTGGSDGLGSSDLYRKALAAEPGDHLAFMFMDLKGFVGLETAITRGLVTTPAFDQAMIDRLPAWFGLAVRAEADHLVVDAAAPMPAGSPTLTNHSGALASHLPATSIAVFEQHDLGRYINLLIDNLKLQTQYRAAIDQFTKALDSVGGLDSFTSWMGDSAVVFTKDGAAYGGGLVIALPDAKAADAAAAKFLSLKNVVALSGADAKVSEAPYAAGTITTLDFGSVSKFIPAGSTTGLPPGALDSAKASVSYSIQGGLVVVGFAGDGFVKATLDAKAGDSLADQARYKTAIDRAGASNEASLYVDLRAVIDSLAGVLPASSRSTYDSQYKPYLDLLQAIAVSIQSGDVTHSRFVLTVSK